jgi:O-antigen/teichoic acid export membrane protein
VQIASVSGFAYAALNFLAMDRFARFLESGSMGEVRRTAVLLARIALVGALPLPFLFVLWGEEIVGRAFGPEFHAAMAPLFLLLGLQVVTASFGMPNSLLMMGGYERRLLAVTGTCVALDAILCLALIPRFGPMGAALASLLSVGALRVALWIAVYRTLGVDTSVVASLPLGRRWKGDCLD